jgi:hypothetical protein
MVLIQLQVKKCKCKRKSCWISVLRYAGKMQSGKEHRSSHIAVEGKQNLWVHHGSRGVVWGGML